MNSYCNSNVILFVNQGFYDWRLVPYTEWDSSVNGSSGGSSAWSNTCDENCSYSSSSSSQANKNGSTTHDMILSVNGDIIFTVRSSLRSNGTSFESWRASGPCPPDGGSWWSSNYTTSQNIVYSCMPNECGLVECGYEVYNCKRTTSNNYSNGPSDNSSDDACVDPIAWLGPCGVVRCEEVFGELEGYSEYGPKEISNSSSAENCRCDWWGNCSGGEAHYDVNGHTHDKTTYSRKPAKEKIKDLVDSAASIKLSMAQGNKIKTYMPGPNRCSEPHYLCGDHENDCWEIFSTPEYIGHLPYFIAPFGYAEDEGTPYRDIPSPLLQGIKTISDADNYYRSIWIFKVGVEAVPAADISSIDGEVIFYVDPANTGKSPCCYSDSGTQIVASEKFTLPNGGEGDFYYYGVKYTTHNLQFKFDTLELAESYKDQNVYACIRTY